MLENFKNLQVLWKQVLVSCNTNSARVIFHHGSCSHLLGNKKFTRIMFAEKRSPILREITLNETFKESAKFPSRIKTIVSRKFSRITNAISEQNISHVTTDLYKAKWPNKPRIVWRYKINMLLFVCEYALFVCIWSKHLKLYLKKWSLIQMSLKKHSLYNLNWSCFEHTVACANITVPRCVTAVCLNNNTSFKYYMHINMIRDTYLKRWTARLSLY